MTDLQQSLNNTFGLGRDFGGVNSLCSQLFLLMRSGSELYLSNNYTSDKKFHETGPESKNLLKSAKDSLLKLLPKTKDEGIEMIVQAGQEGENKELIELDDEVLINGLKECAYSKPAQPKFSVAGALKKLYTSFTNYGKKGYETIKTNIKKVVDNVKLTTHKIAKLCEYLLAKTNPQWNMPWGSKFDLDVLSSTISSGGSVNEENKKYQIGYGFLRYQD